MNKEELEQAAIDAWQKQRLEILKTDKRYCRINRKSKFIYMLIIASSFILGMLLGYHCASDFEGFLQKIIFVIPAFIICYIGDSFGELIRDSMTEKIVSELRECFIQKYIKKHSD